ncbi:MAG: iduronate-2-sulfatase [Flavobacteriaceae bacterium]|nr:iduronate-2-sulfatase [Flavobacteriaceae bacterium]|tara:strand:- start:108 stop:1625 length:1518 start_codon:yes stop_codon:yes gene_type:complete
MRKLFSVFFLVHCFFSLFAQKSSDNPNSPNVIVFMVDDLKPNLGIFNDSYSKSPNIDQLGREGMRFNYAYANQAVCVASRYNFMLGKRSTSTGLYTFGVNFRVVYPEMETLPQLFKKNGYHAESIGKVYHVGHGNTNDEDSWSIPHHGEKVIEYIVPESDNEELTREEALFENYNLYVKEEIDIKKLPRGAAWEAPDVSDEAYADGRIARHAINRLRVLNENKKQPFFMAIGFIRPHLPFSVPKKYWDLYDKSQLPLPEYEIAPKGSPSFAVKRGGEINNFKPIDPYSVLPFEEELKRNLIHGYYASISYMDKQLGRVMREIKNLSLDKNTIIVLWGDHGWHLGDHGIWTKHTNYEQSTRIPIIIKAPGITEDGSICNQTVETVDLFPTLADLANLERKVPFQELDGKSLTPLLKDPSNLVKDHIYHSYIRQDYMGEAIRNKRYRMIRWTHLKEKNNIKYELYDYENDHQERVNIAKKNQDVINKMSKLLECYPTPKRMITNVSP